MNMALDESCIEHVANGASPTVRFYDYDNHAAIIGFFQKMHEEVDVEFCRMNDIHCVRRITGGGAMYLDKDGAITYSVVAPEHMLPKNIHDSYREVSQWVINGLRKIGIESEFKPINDITINGRKVSGSALTKKKNVVMVHGTILYSLDVERMFRVLKVPKEKISDKMIKDVKERVTSILDHTSINREDVYRVLQNSFSENKEHVIGQWNQEELERARELVESKYKSEDWVFRR